MAASFECCTCCAAMCVGERMIVYVTWKSSCAESALLFRGAWVWKISICIGHKPRSTVETILFTPLTRHILPKSIDTQAATPAFKFPRHSLSIDNALFCGWLNVE